MRTHQLQGPGLLVPRQVAAPSPEGLADGEVLVRTVATSICGSDMPHFARGGPVGAPAPVGYPLHEITGEVVGSRSPGLSAGDRVVGWAANDNGLSELVVTDGRGLVRFDDGLDPWWAIVAQPLACVLYAVDRLPDVSEQDVAVVGLGSIGLLFSHVLRRRGAATVTGVDPVDRSDVAERMGVTHLVQESSAAWVGRRPVTRPPAVVVEAVGHQVQTLGHAIAASAFGGTIYAFGIPHLGEYPVDVTTLVRKNLTLIGGITTNRRTYLTAALRYLEEHPELPEILVTNVLPTSAAQHGFELASHPRPGQLKIVLTDAVSGS